jgi:hypothetical protein
VLLAAGVPPPLQTRASNLVEHEHRIVLELANHPEPGGPRGVLHLLQLRDITFHGCNKGITHKISQEISKINPSVAESRMFTERSLGTVTLIGLIKFKGSGFKPEKKSIAVASTGQEKYNWNPIQTGNHTAFSKGGLIQFSMNFTVSQSNQIVRIFFLIADPAIN